MARLFRVSCGPLPVLLLLLASVPVMESLSFELARPVLEGIDKGREHLPGLVDKATGREHSVAGWAEPQKALLPQTTLPDNLVRWGAEKLTPYALRKMNVPEDFIKGVKQGFKTCKILNKLQSLIPGGGTTTNTVAIIPIGDGTSPVPILTADITATDHKRCGPEVAVGLQRLGPGSVSSSWAVVGIGNGGELSKTLPQFSYQVGADGRAFVWLLPTASAQQQATTIPFYTNPRYPLYGRYYVKVTGIRVGNVEVVRTPTQLELRPDGTGGVYLSTMEPYTSLESGVYFDLKKELMQQISWLNGGAVPTSQGPADKLCYMRTYPTKVPPMAILFGGNAVMELRKDNVWYTDQGSDTVCLAILPTDPRSPDQASFLGSWLQTDRMMTIDVTHGTLTF